jgi:uncharacterized protein YkwD
MVNRVAVYLIGGIVLVGVLVVGGAGYFVFAGLGNADAGGTPTAVDRTSLDPSPTPTATATAAPAATATPTATTTTTPTATTARRTAVLPSELDERRVEVLIVEEINDRRTAEGLDPLLGNGTVPERLRAMARDHSVAMADTGRVNHVIDGNASVDRYEDNDLYRLCRWKAEGREAIIAADNNGYAGNESALEAVGHTYAGREYDDGQFNEDEEAVAAAIVEDWYRDYRFERRLMLPNATMVGVGATITQSGEVYATADLCRPNSGERQ